MNGISGEVCHAANRAGCRFRMIMAGQVVQR